jgi:hypothetical protein
VLRSSKLIAVPLAYDLAWLREYCAQLFVTSHVEPRL